MPRATITNGNRHGNKNSDKYDFLIVIRAVKASRKCDKSLNNAFCDRSDRSLKCTEQHSAHQPETVTKLNLQWVSEANRTNDLDSKRYGCGRDDSSGTGDGDLFMRKPRPSS